ncbi:MAG: hypothetical protein Q9180_005723, partial [Flavoplaca navasiana]
MDLLSLDERSDEDILQESKDIAEVIQCRLLSLQADLRNERETSTGHLETVNYWKRVSIDNSRQINSLKNDVTRRENSVQAHIKTIAGKDTEIAEHLGRIDYLQESHQRIQEKFDESNSTLTNRTEESERLATRVQELEAYAKSQEERFEEVKERLQDAESKYNSLESAKEEVESRLKEASEAHRREIIEAGKLQTATVAEAAKQQEQSERIEAEGQQRESHLTRDIASLKGKLQRMEETLSAEKQRVLRLEDDKTIFQEHVRGLEDTYNKAQVEVSELRNVNAAAQAQLSKLEKDFEGMKQEASKTQDQLATTSKALATEKATGSRLRNERNNCQTQIQKLSEQRQMDQQRIKDLSAQVHEREAQTRHLKALQEGYDSRDHDYRKQSEMHATLKAELDDVKIAKQGMQDERDKLRNDLREAIDAVSNWKAIDVRSVALEDVQLEFIAGFNQVFMQLSANHQPVDCLESALGLTRDLVKSIVSEMEVTTKIFRTLLPSQPVTTIGIGELNSMLQAIEALYEDMAGIADEKEKYAGLLEKHDHEIARLRTEVGKALKEQGSMKEQHSVKVKEVQELRDRLSQVSEHEKDLQEQYNSTLHNLGAAEKNAEQWRSKYDQALTEPQEATQKISALQNEYDQAIEDNQYLKSKDAVSQDTLNMVIQESAELQEKYDACEENLRNSESHVTQLMQSLEDLEKTKDTLQKEFDDFKHNHPTIVSSDWKEQFETSQRMITEKIRENIKMKSAMDTATAEKQELHEEVDLLRDRLVEIDEKRASFESFMNAEIQRNSYLKEEVNELRLDRNEWKRKYEASQTSLSERARDNTGHTTSVQPRYSQTSDMSSGSSQIHSTRHSLERNKRSTPPGSEEPSEPDNSDTVATEHNSMKDMGQRKRTRTAPPTAGPSQGNFSVTGAPPSANILGTNRNEEPWIAIDTFRNSTFTYGDLPQALFNTVRQQMDLWDSKKGPGNNTGSWTEGAKGRAKGQVKCAHHFAQHDG